MNFQRGEVIKQGQIEARLYFCKGWKITIPGHNDLLIKLMPNKCNKKLFKKGDKINDFVVIQREGNLISVALTDSADYVNDLFEYYYYENYILPQILPKRDRWTYWYKKWRDECKYDNFRKKGFSLKPTLINKMIFKFFELKSGGYRLPVPAPEAIEHIIGEPIFYPHVFYDEKDSKEKTGLAVYKPGNNKYQFPLAYSGNLIGRSLPIVREIKIYFHGFINPYKWHFGIWKHVYNQQNWPDSRCDFKEFNCNNSLCRENNLFKQVHPKILNNCLNYLQEIVTFFENDTTKKMVSPINKKIYTMIKLICYNLDKRKKLYMRGVSHNWDAKTPTIHVPCVTYYDLYANRYTGTQDIPDGVLELKNMRRL